MGRLILRAVVCGCALLTSLTAATVFGTGTWNPLPAPSEAGVSGGQPYFSNPSCCDGPNTNIGYKLATLGFTGHWYGAANGRDWISDFFFQDDGIQYTLSILGGVTGNTIEFGWYDINNPNTFRKLGDNIGGQSHLTVGTNVFDPGVNNYGFYIHYLAPPGTTPCSGYPTDYFRTQASANTQTGCSEAWRLQMMAYHGMTLPAVRQHFAVFRSSDFSQYVIAMEDNWAYHSGGGIQPGVEVHGDFQDLYLQLTVINQGVPEPATFALAGLALTGLVAFRRVRSIR